MSKKLDECFSQLLNGDSPFRWEIRRLDENLKEEDLENVEEFSFLNYGSKLLEVYRLFGKNDLDAALNEIDELHHSLAILREDKNSPFLSIFKALKHVFDISKVTILLMCQRSEECFETLDSMTPFGELNENEEAAILALRSVCCSMFSYQGTQDALDFIDRAIRKDSNMPFWRFLKAMYLYKLRTISNCIDAPSSEERELLKKVNEEEENNPLFMVYLADVYRESAVANDPKKLELWFVPEESKKDSKAEFDNMFKQSKMLYEKAYTLRPKCPKIAFRCASGLMKLPGTYQNVKLAKQIIKDIMPIYKTSGFGNLVCAFYSHKYEKNPSLAKKHLETAMELNVFNGHLNFISLNCRENPEKFRVDSLKKLLDIFKEAPKRKMIYAQIISYLIFVKNPPVDLDLVCENFMNYLKEEGPRRSLENHRSLFHETKEPISLLDVVLDEIKFAIGNRSSDPKSRKKLDEFVHKLNFYNIWPGGKPQNLKRQILQGKIPVTKSRCVRPQNHPSNQRNNAGSHKLPERTNFNNGKHMKNPSGWNPHTGSPHGRPGGAHRFGRMQTPRTAEVQVERKAIGEAELKENVGQVTEKPAAKPQVLDVGLRTEPTDEKKHRDREEERNRNTSDIEYSPRRRRSEHSRRKKYFSTSSSTTSDRSEERRRRKRSQSYSTDASYDKRGRRYRKKRSESCSSKDSYDRRGRRYRKKRSESYSSDDSYDRRGRRYRKKRSESSSSNDSYVRRGRRHRRRSKEHRRDYEKREHRRHRRNHSSVSEDSTASEHSKGRRYEKEKRSRARYRSVSPSVTSSSECRYEKRKSSRRDRGQSPSDSYRRRHRKSEEDQRYLTKKMDDISLDYRTKNSVAKEERSNTSDLEERASVRRDKQNKPGHDKDEDVELREPKSAKYKSQNSK